MTNVTIQNYPAEAGTLALRQVVFGGGDAINVLVSITLDDDDEQTIEVVIGNGPRNEEALDEAAELFRSVAEILESPETQESWLTALENQKEEENE